MKTDELIILVCYCGMRSVSAKKASIFMHKSQEYMDNRTEGYDNIITFVAPSDKPMNVIEIECLKAGEKDRDEIEKMIKEYKKGLEEHLSIKENEKK